MSIKKQKTPKGVIFRVRRDGKENVPPAEFHKYGIRHFDMTEGIRASLADAYALGFVRALENLQIVRTTTGFAIEAFDDDNIYRLDDLADCDFMLHGEETITITFRGQEGEVSKIFKEN